MAPSTTIPDQKTLPLNVAAGVVAQGIRIRLGRSIVTLTGVVLGIAFLMSILTTQALKRAAAAEDTLRETATRMYGALVAESGPVYGKPLALVVTEPPSVEEQRLVAKLVDEGAGELRVWSRGAEQLGTSARAVAEPAALGRDAAALIVLGSGPWPDLDLGGTLAAAKQKVVALGEQRAAVPQVEGAVTVQLGRPPSAEQQAQMVLERRRARFRGLWIIAISLVVTVIGISNAMLMSVTERFRDIGTMKCLGATSRFIRRLFLLEASFMGAVGGAVGVLGGFLFAIASHLLVYGPALLGRSLAAEAGSLGTAAAGSLLAGIVLSVVAALYPAHFASNMLPAAALRTNV